MSWVRRLNLRHVLHRSGVGLGAGRPGGLIVAPGMRQVDHDHVARRWPTCRARSWAAWSSRAPAWCTTGRRRASCRGGGGIRACDFSVFSAALCLLLPRRLSALVRPFLFDLFFCRPAAPLPLEGGDPVEDHRHVTQVSRPGRSKPRAQPGGRRPVTSGSARSNCWNDVFSCQARMAVRWTTAYASSRSMPAFTRARSTRWLKIRPKLLSMFGRHVLGIDVAACPPASGPSSACSGAGWCCRGGSPARRWSG